MTLRVTDLAGHTDSDEVFVSSPGSGGCIAAGAGLRAVKGGAGLLESPAVELSWHDSPPANSFVLSADDLKRMSSPARVTCGPGRAFSDAGAPAEASPVTFYSVSGMEEDCAE